MPNYAIIDGEDVVNTVLCESKEVAESVTGKTAIEITEGDHAETGGTYINGKFIQRKPFPSWVYDGNHSWNAPVAYPEIDETDETEPVYGWNEETLSWQVITPTEL